MNPGGRRSATGTPLSVSDIIAEDTDELLWMAASEEFGKRKQAILKALVCRESEYPIY
jgi:hypothetical protein